MKRKRKKKRLRVWVYILFLFLFILLFAIASKSIARWFYDNYRSKLLNDDLLKNTLILNKDGENKEFVNPPDEKESDYWYYTKIPLLQVDFSELLKKNSDTVGWIQVAGTNINYPIVQTNDNKYYLTHAFDKSYNSAGWVFSDYRNDFSNLKENTIIYGHGRLDKTVFGSLKNVLTKTWQSNKDNYVVHISTPYENSLWQVFSVYEGNAESYYLTSTFYGNDKEYEKFLTTLKNRSSFYFNTPINTNDSILTLSTCSEDNIHRIVLHAKLIKKEKR